MIGLNLEERKIKKDLEEDNQLSNQKMKKNYTKIKE